MKCFYISNKHMAAVMYMRTYGNKYGQKYEKIYDTQEAENEAAFCKAFQALQAGEISIFYTCQSCQNNTGNYYRTFTAYHRSPKQPGYIQESCYFTRGNDPEIIAQYDIQHATAADAIREGIKAGAYITK